MTLQRLNELFRNVHKDHFHEVLQMAGEESRLYSGVWTGPPPPSFDENIRLIQKHMERTSGGKHE